MDVCNLNISRPLCHTKLSYGFREPENKVLVLTTSVVIHKDTFCVWAKYIKTKVHFRVNCSFKYISQLVFDFELLLTLSTHCLLGPLGKCWYATYSTVINNTVWQTIRNKLQHLISKTKSQIKKKQARGNRKFTRKSQIII